MTLEEKLIKFGLDTKEAKVYLATLQTGLTTVLQIAKRAGIKRPTAYNVLDTLAAKGYIAKSYKNKKLLYAAERPEVLLLSLKNKEQLLSEALPELQAITAATKHRPKVSIYEGMEGMHQVYSEIYASHDIRWFSSIKDINKNFKDALDSWVKVTKTKKPRVREIVTADAYDITYARELASDTHELRSLPPELSCFVDCAIYDNKLAIFSVRHDLFCVVVESQEVATSFRSLHELAWRGATPLEHMSVKA